MIVLDYRDKRPVYEQIEEKLSRLIVCGVLEPGGKMPSVRNLAMELSVNPNTVQRAYANLEKSGYIHVLNGRGNFVSEPEHWKGGHLQALEEELRGILIRAREDGMPRENVELCVREVYEAVLRSTEAPELAQTLKGGNE